MNIDYIPGTKLHIRQDRSKFSFGVDAILLSSFAPRGERALDLCTGNGIVLLRLFGLGKIKSGIGIEIQEDVSYCASESVELNELKGNLDILNEDLKDVKTLFQKNSFDLVTANPPYIKHGGGIVNTDENFAMARHELTMTFEDVVSAASHVLCPGGSFSFIHKPERLAELIVCLKSSKLEPKRMRLVQPNSKKAPNMVLIEAKKFGKEGISVLETLNVYGEDGEYTKELLYEYGK